MTQRGAINAFEQQFLALGYTSNALMRDYEFPDVTSEVGVSRSVQLAAFTSEPPSYRYAAFGVIENKGETDSETQVAKLTSLGAPILFCISGNQVSAWQALPPKRVNFIERFPLSKLTNFFQQYADNWSPRNLQLAKSSITGVSPQMSFIDAGLLPALEKDIHQRLDSIIKKTLEAMLDKVRVPRKAIDQETFNRNLYQTLFRLLMAKILIDLEHEHAEPWRQGGVQNILDGVEKYYNLADKSKTKTDTSLQIEDAWKELNSGITFQNISADNLVFVYENTLVTDSKRSQFSIHSTPWRVAEHVVQSLRFDKFTKDNFTVYEPFAGAGVFLVTAMRHMRDNLDQTLSPAKRHDLLVKRLTGAEIDPFAREVATLSLVLADYPNPNGWEVKQDDLFIGNALKRGASGADVILCNPPFEQFEDFEKRKYPEAVKLSEQKPIMILDTILDCKPEAIGFVLPHSFLQTARYDSIRRRIEDQYGYIELASLPDNIFPHAAQESALLIAREKRGKEMHSTTKLVAVRVEDSHRNKFLATGKYTSRNEDIHSYPSASPGNLWLKDLSSIWNRLDRFAKLDEVVEIHRGLEWVIPQPDAFSQTWRPGHRKGFDKASSYFFQYAQPKPTFLDFQEKHLRGNKINLPWGQHKLIVNRTRLGRGPWRIACVVDQEELIASQAFHVMWLNDNSPYSLKTLAAIVNGPLFNAFVHAHEGRERDCRRYTLQNAPLPPAGALQDLDPLVFHYERLLAKQEPNMSGEDHIRLLDSILKEIDAKVLQAYDLPPRLEKKLLEYFRGYERPVSHKFTHWYPENFKSCIPLHEYISSEYKRLKEPWVLDVFRPLPEKEAKALAPFLNK